MALARIRIAPAEAGTWTATCHTRGCRWRVVRSSRLAADVAGNTHQRNHQPPADPADQVNDLEATSW